MTELIFLVEEASEGGYTAKALGEDIFTQADNIEQLKVSIADAIQCHYDIGRHSFINPKCNSISF